MTMITILLLPTPSLGQVRALMRGHAWSEFMRCPDVRRGDHRHFSFKAISSSRRNTNKNVFGRGAATAWTGHAAGRKITTSTGAVVNDGKSKYQLVVCDTGSNPFGFFMSELNTPACFKTCDNDCNDKGGDWYRHAGSSAYNLQGVSFRENGFGNKSNKKVSVAIRYRSEEPFHWFPPHN